MTGRRAEDAGEPVKTPAASRPRAARAPDRYRLAVTVAPFWRRLLADLLDLTLLGAVVWLLWTAGVIAPAGGLPPQQFDWIDYTAELLAEHLHRFRPAAVAALGIGALYGVITRLVMGGTIGERLLGLRLVAADGERAGPLRALIHAFGTLLGLALLTVGYAWAAADLRRQGLAEYLSGTMLTVGMPARE